MTTKASQIMALDAQGKSTRDICQIVGCKSAYVRAVRCRATPQGRDYHRKWQNDYYHTNLKRNADCKKTARRHYLKKAVAEAIANQIA